MTVAEKVEIVHEVIIRKCSHKEVAFEYQVKTCVVNVLVQRTRRNPKYLEELRHAEEKRSTDAERIR